MAKLSKKALSTQTEKIIKTSAILYLGLAVVAILLMNTAANTVAWNYSAADGLQANTYSELSQAEKTLFSLEIRYALAGVLVFSSVLLILLATNLKKKYDRTVKAGISGYRWLYMGLTFGPLLALSSMLAGVTSLAVLKSVALASIIVFILTWLVERETRASKATKWFAYIAAILAAITAFEAIFYALLGTWLYGVSAFAWYVYAVAGVVALAFVAALTNQCRTLKAKGEWQAYEFAERNYFAIDIAAKTAVALILVIAFYR